MLGASFLARGPVSQPVKNKKVGKRKKSDRGTHKGDASSTRRGSEEVTA